MLEFAALFFELGQSESFFARNSLRVEKDDMLNFGTLAQRFLDFVVLLSIREHENARARVVENVTHLWRRQRRINRNVNRARKDRTGIGQRPFDSTLGKQCDTIAGTRADCMQSRGDVLHALQHHVR